MHNTFKSTIFYLTMEKTRPTKLASLEGEQLEYKQMVSSHAICKAMVAFANTSGGKIMIGVADDGTIVGVDGIKAENIANLVKDGCKPPIIPKINEKNYDGKRVITVSIGTGQNIPYMTNNGIYYIREGATSRSASMLELIDLIVKGPYRDTILSKIRIPQLRNQIEASILANTNFDQALANIAELSKLTWQTKDKSTKAEIVDLVDGLLKLSCNNDEIIRRLLYLLASIVSNDLAQSPQASPPSREVCEQIIEIMNQVLSYMTVDPTVNDRIKYTLGMLFIVGLGCRWANYDEQFKKVLVVIVSQCDRDHKLTKLCYKTANSLKKCADEEPTYPPRRMGMLLEPFMGESWYDSLRSWFRDLR